MGVPVWTTRRSLADEKPIKQELPALEEETRCDIELPNNWQKLQTSIANCTLCELHQSRTNTVFGIGSPTADLMIIGEAPGIDEDINAEPFLGDVGQLLNQMLHAIGLTRQKVFIANLLKCKTPDNRKPHVSEIESCSEYLLQQIRLIKPRVILSLGATSAKKLMHSKERISDLRGKKTVHQETNTPLVATYHPAYLQRAPTAKSKTWQDLLLVKALLDNKL